MRVRILELVGEPQARFSNCGWYRGGPMVRSVASLRLTSPTGRTPGSVEKSRAERRLRS